MVGHKKFPRYLEFLIKFQPLIFAKIHFFLSFYLVETIHGGVTNKLYLCTLLKNGEKYKKVVYREYGLIMDDVDAQITESIVFSMLGCQGLGPKLHGIFPGKILTYKKNKNKNLIQVVDWKSLLKGQT